MHINKNYDAKFQFHKVQLKDSDRYTQQKMNMFQFHKVQLKD